MALIVRIALLLLGTLHLCKTQVQAYRSIDTQKKDAKYGRPVLAMANSPRCMFNGRHVEDGRSVSSPEPCLNCTCSKGILLCYLRTCTTVVPTPGCEVVRKKGECCPKLECQASTEIRTERTNEVNYKYRLRQDESNFFGLLGMDPRTEKSNYRTTTTTKKPAPKLNYKQDDWSSSNINDPSADLETLVEQEEDFDSDQLSADRNDSAGYCYHKGYKYSEGMAMLSPTKCEYCYCIGGQQMCVRPKCHLNIDGCVARYQSGYTCCPSHYQCEKGSDGVYSNTYQSQSANPSDLLNKVSSCNVEGYDFDVGVAVPSSGHCQTCYCTQMGVVCRRLECSPTVPGCTPIVPEGHCCPTEYKCDQQGVNETKVPVSHSTENYDVTVMSPSQPEEDSYHTTEVEEIDDYDHYDNYTMDSYDDDSTTDASTDKQKITVELNDEANLESISVIPEENIAVLVVTTEKGEDNVSTKNAEETSVFPYTTKMLPNTVPSSYFKQKTRPSTARSSSTVSDETQYSQDTTKPIIISLPNLKQKTKPTTVENTLITHGFPSETTRPFLLTFPNMKQKTKSTTTRYTPTVSEIIQHSQYVTKPSVISLPNLKHKSKPSTTSTLPTSTKEYLTEEPTPSSQELYSSTEAAKSTSSDDTEYNGEDKDYTYDYVELYENVNHEGKETFAPFADYSEPAFGERLTSTEKTQETTTNTNTKVKNKKIPTKRNPITSVTASSVINTKLTTEDLNTHRTTDNFSDQSTYFTVPAAETDTNSPTKYTIFSTSSEKHQLPFTTESSSKQKQKVKPNKNTSVTNTQQNSTTIKHTTPLHPTTSQITTRTYKNGEEETSPDYTLDELYRTDIHRSSPYYMKQPTVITSNHKQKPLRLSQTTLPYKSTKPLPHEIAELLWTITQNAQHQDASTETYIPSTKQETHISNVPEHFEYFPDNLSSLVVAAPKLIVEDTTAEESHGTLQLDTTNSDTETTGSFPPTNGSPPGLIFKVPDIIFSNHGPGPSRKQPQPIRETGLQGIRKTGQQTVWEHNQQIVRQPGQQPVRDHNQKPVRDHIQQPIRDHIQQPVRDHIQQPVRDHSQQPVRDHIQQPVRDHSQQPVRDHNQQPVRDHNQQPVRDHSQQPVRDHSQQPMRDHNQQPVRDHGQQPVRDHNEHPVRDHGQQPVRDHGQQPVRDHGQQPVRDHIQQPVRDHTQIAVKDHGQKPVRDHGQKPVRDPILQTVRKPGQQPVWENDQQPVRESILQTVQQPGKQPIRESGLQTVLQTGKQPSHPSIITVRQPGQQPVWDNNSQSVKQPGLQTVRNPGKQPVRVPEPPMEINNHKKTLRPRPVVRFRPSSAPSVLQSTKEISNHRPINTFRRPPSNFPPYPSYNQRSDLGYRSQQNPRDPHHSLHRIDPDLHPEWREDYDEYYYDLEQGKGSATRVFTNMKEYETTKNFQENAGTYESSGTYSLPTTRQQTDSNLKTDIIDEDENRSTSHAISVKTTKILNPDAIEGRASFERVDETTEEADSTTPYTTTISTIATTKEFFVNNSTLENDVKLFRAEDSNKKSEASFIDHRHEQHHGKPNKFEVINGRPSAEKPVLKPLTVKPEVKPSVGLVDPPTDGDDSKEINDVCFVDGRYYNSGEIIVKSNPCEMCRCFYGHPLCQVQQCPSPPEPSCILEYLPGYCCPRVTCGIKMDSQSSEVSAPDPTNQEIRPPLITSDNQWKPLPHGPIVRPSESLPKVETPVPDKAPEVVTAPPQPVFTESKTKEASKESVELNVESSYALVNSKEQVKLVQPTTTATIKSTSAITTTTEESIFTATEKEVTTTTTQKPSTATERVEMTTYFPEITAEPSTEPTPVFEPKPEDNESEQNKSDIHDNSSGVRKILNQNITLPPSKMSLSPTAGENISTVLPVIQTLTPTELPELEFNTVANIVLSDLPAELGGNLKVSGCNVYGKYYKINDKVTVLSKKCTDCVCLPDGIACNATC